MNGTEIFEPVRKEVPIVLLLNNSITRPSNEVKKVKAKGLNVP
jgi:hypothetical protein